jgi:hypothetical protein
MSGTVKEVLLTTAGKADRKGYVKRRQRRGTVRKGKKRRYSTSEEGFDESWMKLIFQEKE